QDQYSPVSMHLQTIQILAGTKGIYDDVPTADVRRFITDLMVYFEGPQKAITDELAQKLTLKGNDLESRILEACKSFRKSWK
ncbi:MAG TPA: F0F1 ATP synthase subunit alpha, partial [Myxococcota bacterium]|nr:F0F1 ATP synthase subunit alpha [Myxococcota bacterium]